MIEDRKTEELESKGLYRKVTARQVGVMTPANGDKEREHAVNRRSGCIRKMARPSAAIDRFGDPKQVVKRVHSALGVGEEMKGYSRRYRDKDYQRQ